MKPWWLKMSVRLSKFQLNLNNCQLNSSKEFKVELITSSTFLTISNNSYLNLFVYYINDELKTEWLIYAK